MNRVSDGVYELKMASSILTQQGATDANALESLRKAILRDWHVGKLAPQIWGNFGISAGKPVSTGPPIELHLLGRSKVIFERFISPTPPRAPPWALGPEGVGSGAPAGRFCRSQPRLAGQSSWGVNSSRAAHCTPEFASRSLPACVPQYHRPFPRLACDTVLTSLH